MTWHDVLMYALSGAIVSWPVFLAGQFVSHRKIRAHVDRVTAYQTEQIAQFTDQQTRQLEAGKLPADLPADGVGGRGEQAAERYHGHGEDAPPAS